jgi:hypothetical protein
MLQILPCMVCIVLPETPVCLNKRNSDEHTLTLFSDVLSNRFNETAVACAMRWLQERRVRSSNARRVEPGTNRQQSRSGRWNRQHRDATACENQWRLQQAESRLEKPRRADEKLEESSC